jgi:hypothetical protein
MIPSERLGLRGNCVAAEVIVQQGAPVQTYVERVDEEEAVKLLLQGCVLTSATSAAVTEATSKIEQDGWARVSRISN